MPMAMPFIVPSIIRPSPNFHKNRPKALAGFVKSAAIEMPRGIRVNVVSPGLLEVSQPRYGQWFHGHKPVSSLDVGRAYAKSVEGALTGQVIIVA